MIEKITGWRDETRRMLQTRPINLTREMIAHQTGLKEHWIKAFEFSVSDNPGVNNVQTLYEFLKNYKAI